tara:strand:- start:32675 stop:35131 length:2457 start_codon:yes stop_codon:yes gene_type:complete
MKKTLQKYLCGLCASAFMIGAFTIQANAQNMETKWERTSRTGAAETKPSFIDSYVRGMAYHDGLLYYLRGSSKVISVVDASTGADVTPGTAFDASGVLGNWPHAWDIEVSTDGKVFSVNYTSGAAITDIKLYMGDVSGGALTEVATLTPGSALKVGNKFTVVGSVADNTAEVWIPVNDSRTVFVFTTADQGATWSSNEITLTGGTAMATSPVAVPLTTGGSSDFYVAGHGSKIQRFTSTGVYVTGSEITQTGTTSRGGLKTFQLDGEDYIAVYTTRINNTTTDDNGRVQVFNVDNATSPVLYFTSPVLGDTDGATSYLGDAAVRVNSDGSFDVYAVDPEHGIAAYESGNFTTIKGIAGWRLLSSPTSDNTYDDLLGDIWTQGIATGADVTTGSASVMSFNGSSFVTVDDLTATMPTGVGFAAYVYSDDDYDASDDDAGFPKILSVAGTANAGSILPTISTGADTYTLVGNPYNSTIDSDSFTRVDVNTSVWVYDSSLPGYITWSGVAGGLTDGLIAPFQGFWVQNDAVGIAPVLTIKEADKSTGGTLYKSEPSPVMSFKIESETQRSQAYFSFTPEGKMGDDNMDAAKLTPLDFVNYISIASESEGRLLDINNLPRELESEIEIPISISAMKVEGSNWVERSEDMTITWPALDNIPSDWEIEFVDYQEQIRLDVRTEESYSFTSNSGIKQEKKGSMFEAITPQKQKASKGNRFSLVIRSKAVVSNEPNELPSDFALEQNYPNPFNPTTTVNYSIGKSGLVSLKIYNTMGQEVANLVNEVKGAGSYSITWDAQNLSSGMYFYRLSTAGQTITRQMTLIK